MAFGYNVTERVDHLLMTIKSRSYLPEKPIMMRSQRVLKAGNRSFYSFNRLPKQKYLYKYFKNE